MLLLAAITVKAEFILCTRCTYEAGRTTPDLRSCFRPDLGRVVQT